VSTVGGTGDGSSTTIAVDSAADAIEGRALEETFSPPRWLRDLGRASWYLVGFFVLLAAVAWFLGATYTIVGPVVAATIVATVRTRA